MKYWGREDYVINSTKIKLKVKNHGKIEIKINL